ncbi:hypothetical protein Cylst_3672 [Cylindrospermum stagnale PCC 7417]|uniref:Uncharacterized protein n=1 Tax=Cylindrospermum stagnale PCC 7417 TaxID=56107 RepID=K9X175_9NOST|nr:hypothetical protein [Cylindrospermum stagnale]AFZ25796.1 hypothetical protein Cylst_3672 [Cylindrospermum stagnale PCC 7417]
MAYERIHKSSSWKPDTPAKTEPSRFAPRSFKVKPQQESGTSSSHQNNEMDARVQDKNTASGLEMKEKLGSITPEEKEHLGVLRAKIDDFAAKKREEISSYRNPLDNPSFFTPRPQAATPRVQMKLTLRNQEDKNEKEADRVAADVVYDSAPQSQSIQRQETPLEEKSDSHNNQNAEPQSWIAPAYVAIKDGRFQDALKAYEEGVKLNLKITPTVKRDKLNILESDEQTPSPLEKETEEKTPLPSENKTEIAQSNPGVFSNLPPWAKRDDPNDEAQRQKAIQIISDKAKWIYQVSKQYNVTPDAIAGAILWEGIENPYPRWRVIRPDIPGKIHSTARTLNPFDRSEAEKVEEEGRVPPLISKNPSQFEIHNLNTLGAAGLREARLRNSEWAIMYIGAILDRAADIYEAAAKRFAKQDVTFDIPPRPIYNVRDQAGILGALYQGGNPDKRAEGFENRRTDAFQDGGLIEQQTVVPIMDKTEKMGPWISQYRWWIQDLLEKNGCPRQGFAPEEQIGPQRPLNVPIPSPFYPKDS